MRLEVRCENRPGMAREILDLLSAVPINVLSGEFASERFIYLHTPDMTLKQLKQLLPKIRAIRGVDDVHPIALMPGEKRQVELQTLLDSLPDPVLLLDLTGRVLAGNQPSAALLQIDQSRLAGYPLASRVTNSALTQEINRLDDSGQRLELVILNQRLLGELRPIKVPVGSLGFTLTGAVLTLRRPMDMSVTSGLQGQGFEPFFHQQPAMSQLVLQARKMARLDDTLLLEGETGTGKELLARACHQAGARRDGPFVVLDCASLSDERLDSEVFGRADPGEDVVAHGLLDRAAGGTLYLDRIDEASGLLQRRLLRFLQHGYFHRVGGHQEVFVDVRVIAASQQSLLMLSKGDAFRQDLYHRLQVLQLFLPPLRERREELLALAGYLLDRLCHRLALPAVTLSADLQAQLLTYTWPGNVRELENQLLSALMRLDEESVLYPHHLRLPGLEQQVDSAAEAQDSAMLPWFELADSAQGGGYDAAVAAFERALLSRLYPLYPSSRKLARYLGVSHSLVARKLRQFALGRNTPVNNGLASK